jgi:hypothetical protein
LKSSKTKKKILEERHKIKIIWLGTMIHTSCNTSYAGSRNMRIVVHSRSRPKNQKVVSPYLKKKKKLVMVAYAYNPSYIGGRSSRIMI